MKIETMKVYKCDCCGCNFTDMGECKAHEDAHYDLNLIPIQNQHYCIGKLAPTEIILTGMAIKDRKPVFKDFIYVLKGEINND